jgi:hypothetical protein
MFYETKVVFRFFEHTRVNLVFANKIRGRSKRPIDTHARLNIAATLRLASASSGRHLRRAARLADGRPVQRVVSWTPPAGSGEQWWCSSRGDAAAIIGHQRRRSKRSSPLERCRAGPAVDHVQGAHSNPRRRAPVGGRAPRHHRRQIPSSGPGELHRPSSVHAARRAEETTGELRTPSLLELGFRRREETVRAVRLPASWQGTTLYVRISSTSRARPWVYRVGPPCHDRTWWLPNVLQWDCRKCYRISNLSYPIVSIVVVWSSYIFGACLTRDMCILPM